MRVIVTTNFVITVAVIFVFMFLVTYLFHRLFRSRRFAKYVPALLSLSGAMYFFYRAYGSANSMEDLGFIVTAILLLAGFLAALISGLLLDFVLKNA